MKNTDYAAIGAVSGEELNILEVTFAVAINFDFHVTEQDYYSYTERMRGRSLVPDSITIRDKNNNDAS